jgi:hypothetical protein
MSGKNVASELHHACRLIACFAALADHKGSKERHSFSNVHKELEQMRNSPEANPENISRTARRGCSGPR